MRGEPSELAVIGRLAPGFTPMRAQAELDSSRAAWSASFRREKAGSTRASRPMTRQLAGETRRPLLLLFGAVAVVLLIACSNVANLLLTRSIARTREFTVRAALGAGRGSPDSAADHRERAARGRRRLGGVAVAYAGVAFVKAFGPSNVPRLAEVRIDPSVLLFAMAVSLVIRRPVRARAGVVCRARAARPVSERRRPSRRTRRPRHRACGARCW